MSSSTEIFLITIIIAVKQNGVSHDTVPAAVMLENALKPTSLRAKRKQLNKVPVAMARG